MSGTTIIPDTGAKTRIAVTIRSLGRLGVGSIDVLAFESPRMVVSRRDRKAQKRLFESLGATLHFRPLLSQRGPGGRTAMVRVAGRLLARFVTSLQPDLVLAINCDAGAASAFATSLSGASPPGILELHGIESEEAIFAGAIERHSSHHLQRIDIEGLAIRWADAVVAPSREAAEWSEKHHPNTASWWALPTLSTMQLSSEERSASRAQIRRDRRWEDKKVLLYVGGMNPWQQPELMASVFVQLHSLDEQWRFLVVTPDVTKAQAILTKAGVRGDLVHVVSASPDQVGSIATAGDIGLLLRRDHLMNRVASPTKFGEYLQMGVPVAVTTALPSAARICSSERVGLTVAGDADEGIIAREIQVFFDAAERDLLADRCRAAAMAHFREENADLTYAKVLSSLGFSEV